MGENSATPVQAIVFWQKVKHDTGESLRARETQFYLGNPKQLFIGFEIIFDIAIWIFVELF